MSLFIYHPDSRTMLPLTEDVFLCDTNDLTDTELAAMTAGIALTEARHRGIRLDTYNMTNFLDSDSISASANRHT